MTSLSYSSCFFCPQAAYTGAIGSSLLKTSKVLRQQLGNVLDKQVKVREYEHKCFLSKVVYFYYHEVSSGVLEAFPHAIVGDLLVAVSLQISY